MTSRLSIPKGRRSIPKSRRSITDGRSHSRKRRRGPRGEAGKSRASRKTLRHGLAAISRHNPTLFPEVERMAKALCNGDTNPLLWEQALVIAENEMVLRSVRAERVAVIERLRDRSATPLTRRDSSLARAKARFRGVKLKYKWLLRAKAKNAAIKNEQERTSPPEPQSGAAQPMGKQKQSRDEFDAMRRAMPDLDRLARYERRAWSRWKRAIREFIRINSMSDS
jgi:hypothetical protein